MDDWNQSEVDKYHPGEVVLFQEKAWTDARTHIHGLKHYMGPQNGRLGESGEKGVVIEDNLLSHLIDKVITCWGKDLPSFIEPQFIPAGMTENV